MTKQRAPRSKDEEDEVAPARAARPAEEKPAVADEAAPLSPPLIELAIGAAWLLGLSAALELVNRVFGRSMVGAAIVGATMIDIAATRAGVRWDELPRPWTSGVRRLGFGVLTAAGIVAIVVAGGRLLGAATVDVGKPALSLALDLVRAAAVGTRDELLLRGIPLVAAARAGLPALPARVFAALTGAAALLLTPGVTAAAVVLAIASGWLFATFWQRGRGAWAAVGAHVGLLLFTGVAVKGGLLDVAFASGHLSLGARAGGLPAYLVAGAALAAAALIRVLPGFSESSAAAVAKAAKK